MRTYSPKKGDIQREWFVVDAQGKTLGRLSSEIAKILRGKHKPTFTPHVDCGDYVIVINADKVRLTGRKASQKMYYRHSGYPGGLREIPWREMMEKHPERAVELAVRGMLPHNSVGRKMFKKLKVYASDSHPHQAQKPTVLEL